VVKVLPLRIQIYKEIIMANGTNRRNRVLGIEREDDVVRRGEQVNQNLITDKGIQTGTTKFLSAVRGGAREAVSMVGRAKVGGGRIDLGGRPTARFTDVDTRIEPEITRRFKESPEFFEAEEVGKPTERLVRERKAKKATQAVGVKPVGVDRKREGKAITEQLSLGEGTRGGGFVDIGTFRRTEGGKTLREELEQPSGFKSTAEILKSISRTSAASAQAKGRQADVKAKTERLKAIGGVIGQLQEFPDENAAVLETLRKQFVDVLSGAGDQAASQTDTGLAARFKEAGFSDEEIKEIFGRLG
jgi:hypothetical protein